MQFIDDVSGKTLLSNAVIHKAKNTLKGNKTVVAGKIGEALAKKAVDAGIKEAVFDRGPRRSGSRRRHPRNRHVYGHQPDDYVNGDPDQVVEVQEDADPGEHQRRRRRRLEQLRPAAEPDAGTG